MVALWEIEWSGIFHSSKICLMFFYDEFEEATFCNAVLCGILFLSLAVVTVSLPVRQLKEMSCRNFLRQFCAWLSVRLVEALKLFFLCFYNYANSALTVVLWYSWFFSLYLLRHWPDGEFVVWVFVRSCSTRSAALTFVCVNFNIAWHSLHQSEPQNMLMAGRGSFESGFIQSG